MEIEFLGNTLEIIRGFPVGPKQNIGYQLDRVQRGMDPEDWKPLKSIGKGVREIRVWEKDGTYRVIYYVQQGDCVYILHAFKKTTTKTPGKVIDLAKKRYKEVTK